MNDTTLKPKTPWMKILLVVSLGLNLAVAGLIIGAKMSGHGGGKNPYAGGTGMRVLMHALPSEKRAEARVFFRQNREKHRMNGTGMRGSLDNIGAAIAAQPFDAEALNDAFNKQKAHIQAMTQDAQQAFVAIVADMTDAERLQYVDNMKKQRQKWRKAHQRKLKN